MRHGLLKTSPEYIAPAGEHRWRLSVRVQPGARRSEPAGVYEGRLRLKVSAPAVDNKANRAVERLVAELLGLRPAKVRVESGLTSRNKTLVIETDNEPAWHRMEPR